jgi:hypothetical protein
VFGWLQADTVAAVWTAAAAIHREKNTVEAAAAAGLQPQQAAANKLIETMVLRSLMTGVDWPHEAAEVHLRPYAGLYRPVDRDFSAPLWYAARAFGRGLVTIRVANVGP